MTHSVIEWRPPLDLALLTAYRKVRMAANVAQRHHDQTVKQVDTIVNRLADEYCTSELDRLEDLRRQLRLLTKGTPITESLSPEDREPLLRHDPNFSQSQYDAETQMLKVIYRKLTMRLHPDRGGDPVVWHEVDVAYQMRDVYRLNAIWFSITEGRNLYWQQSSGVYHVSTELQRYQVHIEKLKQTEGWKAARFYLGGAVNTAVDIVRLYLADKIAALMNEINYTIAKGTQNGEEGNQEVEGPGQKDGQGHEGKGESQRSESREVEEGHDATGEGSPGTCSWW